MRYQHILQAVYAEPWLIKPQAHAVIRDFLSRRLAEDGPPKRPDGVDFCGDAVEVDQMENMDGVAVIPIGGIIARNIGAFERGMGVVDTLTIAKDVEWANKSKDIRGLVLDIDSPGGIVTGTPELADLIASVDKPVFAYSGSMMCSAAYWIASGADRIFSTKSADIGSIGVYMAMLDESERYKEEGVEVEMFRSGTFKGAGYPGTSLTDAQREQMQHEVDAIAAEFKGFVTQFRQVDDSTMQGQSFMGSHAVSVGLVDELVGDIADVIDMV
jgi:signal peptide peptidase SppA